MPPIGSLYIQLPARRVRRPSAPPVSVTGCRTELVPAVHTAPRRRGAGYFQSQMMRNEPVLRPLAPQNWLIAAWGEDWKCRQATAHGHRDRGSGNPGSPPLERGCCPGDGNSDDEVADREPLYVRPGTRGGVKRGRIGGSRWYQTVDRITETEGEWHRRQEI